MARTLFVFVALLGVGCTGSGRLGLFGDSGLGEPPTLAIQPYTGVAAADVETVRKGIADLYRFEIRVLPTRDLPARAYYPPRKRHRATALLEDLDEASAATAGKVVGLTSSDISVTKGEIPDWGIFGLGSIGGKPCVVSSFRLRHGGAGKQLYAERLKKVVNHEVGHTLGLLHCFSAGCLMQDAGGKISTLDNESGELCDGCSIAIAQLNILRSDRPSGTDSK